MVPKERERSREPGKAERTRTLLVEATGEEIAEVGSFSAERVAARAGTSVATFYSHLPTKDAALTAAFSAALDELVTVVDRHLSVETLLEGGLEGVAREFVHASLHFFAAHSQVLRLALARLPEHRPLRVVYREHESQAFSRFSRFIELGQAAGKVRQGDPLLLARAFLVFSQGLNNPLTLGLAEGDPLGGELAALVVALLEPR
ncbi:MAG: TetR/AcrR family transcriptional regulator [Myxococcota bacterium]|nr:TetR/AcrR family transcriptional regulator [Myxococcota bacterium]